MAVVDLIETDCWCGLPFALPKTLYKQCKDNGTAFYCPLGHHIVFRESTADEERRRAERAEQRLAQRDDEIRNLEKTSHAQKGQITKLKKRAAHGTCPCCKRTFVNMARHMRSKHPDFVQDQGAKVVPIKERQAS